MDGSSPPCTCDRQGGSHGVTCPQKARTLQATGAGARAAAMDSCFSSEPKQV